jgi:GT2 family glycosyltransferase
MSFEPQLPFEPNLAGISTTTTPDWDTLKSNPTNLTSDYALLRRMQYLRPAQIAAIKARNHTSVIEVVVIADRSLPEEAVKATRKSLAFQSYDFLKVSVVYTEEHSVVQHIRNTDSEWVWIMMAGDLLAPYGALIAADWIADDGVIQAFYTDEEVYRNGQASFPFHKPDLNVEWLRASPYIGKGLIFRTDAFRQAMTADQFMHYPLAAYETLFRLIETFGVNTIGHIPETLYRTGVMSEEWVGLPGIATYSMRVASEHLTRLGLKHTVSQGISPGLNNVRYLPERKPLVSIVIPIRELLTSIRRLIDGIMSKTVYDEFEIVVVVLSQADMSLTSYLDVIAANNPKVSVVPYYEAFNYSAVLNHGIAKSRGEYICILHPDHQIVGNDWLTNLMSYAQLPDVGVVGSKITYPDGKLQHVGVVMGLQGIANHPYYQAGKEEHGRQKLNRVSRDVSAVTASGSLFRRTLFDKLGRYNADDFGNNYTDVDYSARVLQAGYRIVWTPYVTFITDDTARKILDDTHESLKAERSARASEVVRRKHLNLIVNDPHYSHHLGIQENTPSFAYRTSVMWDPFPKPALPRIITMPGDRSGCGLYRTRGPLDAMQRMGIAEGMSSEWMVPMGEVKRLKVDTLVLQRKTSDVQILFMREYKNYLPEVFKVYELDDPLHVIPEKSVHYGHFPVDIFQRMIDGIQACDRFVCSTQPLADMFSDYHKDIRVRKNCLPVGVWKHIKARKVQSQLPRVGWGGGSSHRGDLELITDVIKHFHGKIHWVFFGMMPEVIKPYVKEFHSAVPIDVYPSMMASLGLDLAIAPVEDNDFNRCKSNLRVLEYGACGYPVVASDVEAYRSDLPGVTLVNDNPDNWIAAIEEMLEDRERLTQRGADLREAIHKDWMLDGDRVHEWLDCWTPG